MANEDSKATQKVEQATRWTPGPWEVNRVTYLSRSLRCFLKSECTFEIAHNDRNNHEYPHWVAHALTLPDAHLIAAAPALYEALQTVMDVTASENNVLHDLRHVCLDRDCTQTVGGLIDAALAAARGEVKP